MFREHSLRHINRVDQSSQAVHINLHKHLKILFFSEQRLREMDVDIENGGGHMAHNTLHSLLLKILTPRPSAPEQRILTTLSTHSFSVIFS